MDEVEALDLAVEAAVQSHCAKSKRGVVIGDKLFIEDK